uniref:Uncharacterized protein n=1 Tax=Murine hepatitis virus TaxID=11138 RepID=Q83349_9BETC|nr:unknown [Murine hepatitis virus]
MPAGLVLS